MTTGTGTQAGQITVMVQIYEFSTDDDKQILVDAFSKAQNQGLLNANALPKMKAVGCISITGTLGMDLSYIKMVPTPTGRRIRFVTNRVIAYGEGYADNSNAPGTLNLTGGEFDLNDSDRKQSKGVLGSIKKASSRSNSTKTPGNLETSSISKESLARTKRFRIWTGINSPMILRICT